MNEDTKLKSEKAPEKTDETQKDELNVEQLEQIAGGEPGAGKGRGK